MCWCRTRCPLTTPRPCSWCWAGRHAAPWQARWRQRRPAHDTRHAADGAWGSPTAPPAGWCPHRTRQRARDPRSAWITARRRPASSPAVGPETGWCGSDAPRDTGHVACGMRHAAVVPGPFFPGPRQKARLRSSNPTLRLSRARKPKRRRSIGCRASAAGGCSAQGHVEDFGPASPLDQTEPLSGIVRLPLSMGRASNTRESLH